MATNKKTTAETTESRGGDCGDGYYNCGGICVPYPCPGDQPDILKDYIQLRTVLDALEINALRYFLEGKTALMREDRAEKIIKGLKPVLRKIGAISKKAHATSQSSGK